MRRLLDFALVVALSLSMTGTTGAQTSPSAGYAGLSGLPNLQAYVLKRSSSYDRSGANADFRVVAPGDTITVLDENGPGEISHIWFTIADRENYHLKRIVLRMYWDGESTPSVEAPIGDFFGLGNGGYFLYQSIPLAVGADKALNSFFPMPFRNHARITVTNEGHEPIGALYWNIDWRALRSPLARETAYFHAQYRQAAPNAAVAGAKTNLDGANNYVWVEASGRGHFVGVTMSVVENADGWWGEGDDMFFIDGEKLPSINGTGTEDYFLGAWDFGGKPFSYGLFGAPVVGPEKKASKWSVYRFHLDSPIPFTKSLRATIEHGHANNRGDNYYSVAYWYQVEPHATFPILPTVESRLPEN
ncbi:MAG: DUF2961 domain-containing protein [Acidobacteria bacterium]|nr:DUF2961 domain-containing protein [Acidobacteriota bacterium]